MSEPDAATQSMVDGMKQAAIATEKGSIIVAKSNKYIGIASMRTTLQEYGKEITELQEKVNDCEERKLDVYDKLSEKLDDDAIQEHPRMKLAQKRLDQMKEALENRKQDYKDLKHKIDWDAANLDDDEEEKENN